MSDTSVTALISISSTHMDALKDRMNLEWKVIFTSIGAFVSLIALDIKSPLDVEPSFLWQGILSFALLTSGYLLFLHRSDLINKSLYIHAESQLIALAKDPAHKVSDQPAIPTVSDLFRDRELLAWLWQSAAIWFFGLICGVVVA